MVANMFLKLSRYTLVFTWGCNDGGIHISQEIFAIHVLTALKPSLEQRRKHVLGLLQLYGDQGSHDLFFNPIIFLALFHLEEIFPIIFFKLE